jgi:uncharacterized protein YktB (UPF0637 family)
MATTIANVSDTAAAAPRFSGFNASDFDSFRIDGLAPRMEAIRSRIQPKFQSIAAELQADVSAFTGFEQFLHIARHARRTVNAPVDTWMAFAHDKRGYKQHPHYQIGLFDDRVFVWLAFIYELPNKQRIAERMQAHDDIIRVGLQEGLHVSFDHMKKETTTFAELGADGWRSAVQRFHDVKKAELLLGRTLSFDDPLVRDGNAFLELARQTFQTLAPLYRLAMDV